MPKTRTKPYTEAGLSRVGCAHCGKAASAQWSLRPCAVGRQGWYPLCREHDIALNANVMTFLRLSDADERLAAYIATRPEPVSPSNGRNDA